MIQRIDSVLYYDLLTHNQSEMDYTVIAGYATLKKCRNKGHSYQPHSNLTGYKLLRHHTGISLSTLYKIVPILIEMKLCNFLDNGGFFMKGNKKTQSTRKKLIPIRVYDKLTLTKSAVKYVIEHSNLKSQKFQMIKKERQSELINARDNGTIKNQKDLESLRRLENRGIVSLSQVKYVETKNLSNRKVAELLYGRQDDTNLKSRGLYMRNKWKEMGLHNTKRRFEKVSDKKYTLEDYLKEKYALREHFGNITWMDGYIQTELSSEVWDTSDNPDYKVPVKKQEKPRTTYEDYMLVREYDGTTHPFLIQSKYLR